MNQVIIQRWTKSIKWFKKYKLLKNFIVNVDADANANADTDGSALALLVFVQAS